MTRTLDEHTDGFWLGKLSMTAAVALKAPDQKDATRILRRTLDEFLNSPLPSNELREMLREEMKR